LISHAEIQALVNLTEQQGDERARVAEHLVRALLALTPPTANPLIAREQIEIAVRLLLRMEPQT
jgi:hypothetical protein